MKQLLKKAKFLSIFVVAISYLGCEDIENIFPAVTSGFTYTITDQGTVTFINTSEEARTYIWDFGDGDSSTEINPVKSYAASGTYTVTLKASNIAGDSDTSEDQLTVNIITPADPCTEETEQSLDATDFDLTFQTDPGASVGSFDAVLTTIANPDFDNAVNPSCQVGQIDRSGSALFANNQIEFDAKFDFNANAGFKLKVWSPVAGTNVLVKLEDKADAGINTEVGAVTTTASAWEELTFDFASSESGKYDKIILFFELNTNTTETYYIDDFRLYGSGGSSGSGCTGTPVAATALPVDFEGCETFLASQNFGAGLTSELVANPFKTGINNSDFVLQVDKPAGSDFFAGIQNTFPSNFDLTTTDTFKVKVYSTKANVVFRFELALNPQTDPVTGNPAPVFVTIPNANEWTEVEFTFTGLPGGPTAYNQLVIKPDNAQGDPPITDDGTYYIDDLILE
ncbi:MAG: PKD domain-containing protein [Maribacter sp.]|nr:PKD domain-containing protein [Maribacter sp.]